MNKIDSLAKQFAALSSDLGDALLAQLQKQDATLAAKVAQAVRSGERLQLRMEFHPDAPAIALVTVDDYEHTKRVMTIPGAMPRRH